MSAARISKRSILASTLLLLPSFLAATLVFLTGSTTDPPQLAFLAKISFLTITITTPPTTDSPAATIDIIKLTTWGACFISNTEDPTCNRLNTLSLFPPPPEFSIAPTMTTAAPPANQPNLLQKFNTTPQSASEIAQLLPFTVNPITFGSLATGILLHIFTTPFLLATLFLTSRRRSNSSNIGTCILLSRTCTLLTTLSTLVLMTGLLLTLVTSGALGRVVVQTVSTQDRGVASVVEAGVSMLGPVIWGVAVLLNAGAAWAALRGSTVLILGRRLSLEDGSRSTSRRRSGLDMDKRGGEGNGGGRRLKGTRKQSREERNDEIVAAGPFLMSPTAERNVQYFIQPMMMVPSSPLPAPPPTPPPAPPVPAPPPRVRQLQMTGEIASVGSDIWTDALSEQPQPVSSSPPLRYSEFSKPPMSQTAFQPPPLLVPEMVLRQAVSLPQGEDINEWLASNLTDFYNQVNLLYGSLTQFCTPETCPTMSAGPKFDYLWADSSLFKKPIRLSAPEYIDTLLTSIQTALDDESVFPTQPSSSTTLQTAAFPKHFQATVKLIFKRLFRVYAHVWHAHFATVVVLGEESHFWTSFRHFVLFVREFGLVERKELLSMEAFIDAMASSHLRKTQAQLLILSLVIPAAIFNGLVLLAANSQDSSFLSAISFVRFQTIVAAFKPASGAREVSLTLTGPCIFIKTSIQCTPFMQGLFDQPRFSLDQNLALTQNPSRLAVAGNLDVVDVLKLLPFTMNPAAFITAVFAEIGMIVTVVYMSTCVYQRYQASPVPFIPSRLHAHFATAMAMSVSLLFISLSLAASVVTSASLNSLITASLTQYGISTSFSIIGPGILALVVGLSVPATWVSWRALGLVMKEDMKELSGDERKKLTFDSFYTLVFGAPKDSVGKGVSRESRYTGVRRHSDGGVAVTVDVDSSELAIEDDVIPIPAAAVLIPPRNESASVLEVEEDIHSGSPHTRPASFIPGIAPYTINQDSSSKRPHTIGHVSEISGPKSPFIPSYDPRSVPLSPPPRTDSFNSTDDTCTEVEPASPTTPPTLMLPPSFPTLPNLSAAAQILNHRATTQLAKTRHPLSIAAQPFSGVKLPTSPLRRALILDEPETPPDSPPLHGTHATAEVSPSPPGSDLSMDPTIVDSVVTGAAVAAAGAWEFEQEEEQEMDDRSFLSGEDELQVVSPGFVIRDAGLVLEGKTRVDENANAKVVGDDSVVEKKKDEEQRQRLSFILDGVQNVLANASKRTRRNSAYLEAVELVKRQSGIFESAEGEDVSHDVYNWQR
ncbi:MOB kinase activator 1B [Chytriomyces hyalinus]|nr:MOB kinase activator 1B [Chytriomyces hyalinus]